MFNGYRLMVTVYCLTVTVYWLWVTVYCLTVSRFRLTALEFAVFFTFHFSLFIETEIAHWAISVSFVFAPIILSEFGGIATHSAGSVVFTSAQSVCT